MAKLGICEWERWSSFLNQWFCEYQKYDDGNCPYPHLICNYKISRAISQMLIEKLLGEVDSDG